MLLASIKKLANQRKKATNPTGTPSKSVYGIGIGILPPELKDNTPATDTVVPDAAGDTGGDGGGE